MLSLCELGGWTDIIGITTIGLHGGDAVGSTPGGIGFAHAFAGVQCGTIGMECIGISITTCTIPGTTAAPGILPLGRNIGTIVTTGLVASGGGCSFVLLLAQNVLSRLPHFFVLRVVFAFSLFFGFACLRNRLILFCVSLDMFSPMLCYT